MRDDQVREVLGKLFPEHDKDARESMGRFLRIIYLYFRANQWVRTIAEAVGISVRAVENVVQRARKVGEEMFGSASSAVDAFGGDYWCCSELKAAQPCLSSAQHTYGEVDVATLQPPDLELKAA